MKYDRTCFLCTLRTDIKIKILEVIVRNMIWESGSPQTQRQSVWGEQRGQEDEEHVWGKQTPLHHLSLPHAQRAGLLWVMKHKLPKERERERSGSFSKIISIFIHGFGTLKMWEYKYIPFMFICIMLFTINIVSIQLYRKYIHQSLKV